MPTCAAVNRCALPAAEMRGGASSWHCYRILLTSAIIEGDRVIGLRIKSMATTLVGMM